MVDWGVFWCCLSPAEQGFLNYMGTFGEFPLNFASRDVYDLAWSTNVGSPGTVWYDYWKVVFSLTDDILVLDDLTIINIVKWEPTIRDSFVDFQGSDNFDCHVPCTFTSTFFALPA